tara:strand:+ start:172 stop:480 length:309 start_codon:yes stop_codon:yes gene_type:complete
MISPTNSTGIDFSIKAQRKYAQETRDWELMDQILMVEDASAAKSVAKNGPALLKKQLQAAEAKVSDLRARISQQDDTDLKVATQAHVMAKEAFRQYVRSTQG